MTQFEACGGTLLAQMNAPLIDTGLQRVEIDGFAFPLGVYPVEPMVPKPGFVTEFEAADGAEFFISGAEVEDWEEWPDRWMFDVLLPAGRVRAFCNMLVTYFPPRVYPILDVLGHDAYREVDPYIAYDLVAVERVFDGLRDYSEWLFEDGMVGWGLMSLEPFLYAFVDEHKIVTIRAELSMKEKIEKLLAAFDLEQVEKLAGPDSVEHEHRTVLLAPEHESKPMAAEEIIEDLRDLWILQFNVDGTTNLDDEGNELGITAWRCVARCVPPPAEEEGAPGVPRYAELILRAANLDEAEELAAGAITKSVGGEGAAEESPIGAIEFVAHDRITPEDYKQMLERETGPDLSEAGVDDLRWLTTEA